MKTKAIYKVGEHRDRTPITEVKEKPLMTYKGLKIKKIDFTETTAMSEFADVEFYDKEGKWTINVNRIEEKNEESKS